MNLELPTTAINIEQLEAALLDHPDAFVGDSAQCPLEHHFAPGVYLRTVTMPGGMFIVGHKHRTKHLNIVHSGRVRVLMGDEVHEIVGPCTFVSDAGIRKVLFVLEDTRWSTIHVTPETDMEKLRSELIEESDAFISHREKELLISAGRLTVSEQLTAEKGSEASQESAAEQPAMPAESIVSNP